MICQKPPPRLSRQGQKLGPNRIIRFCPTPYKPFYMEKVLNVSGYANCFFMMRMSNHK